MVCNINCMLIWNKMGSFSTDWYLYELLSMPHLFCGIFSSVKFFDTQCPTLGWVKKKSSYSVTWALAFVDTSLCCTGQLKCRRYIFELWLLSFQISLSATLLHSHPSLLCWADQCDQHYDCRNNLLTRLHFWMEGKHILPIKLIMLQNSLWDQVSSVVAIANQIILWKASALLTCAPS